MAGHSQFKNIMRRKGAQDAKRGKLFTKIIREIISACKTGSADPGSNPRLRAAILWAREENMTRDRIEAAIKRGSGNSDTDNYEAIRYEGYGPGGVAIIIEALTDNRNRTASDVRAAFSKHSGNLGETGSVGFMFNNVGLITYPAAKASEDAMFEAALDAGADNHQLVGDHHEITCSVESFGALRDALEKKFGEPASAKLTWVAGTTAPIGEEQATQLMKLVEALEDNDDVQNVITNADIAHDVLEKISA